MHAPIIIRALLYCVLFVNFPPLSKEWHGITPLHSTRADVERVLGASVDPSGSTYETDNEKVSVWYSDEPCRKGISELWNVPKDTVLSITLYPKRKMSVSDLNLNPAKYRRIPDSHLSDIVQYVDDNDGIQIEVSAIIGRTETVTSITYGPSVKDRHLRCPGAPAPSGEDVTDSHIRKFDEYSKISFAIEKARLDNFAIYLQQDQPEYKGYIIVYAGRRARAGEAKVRGERARNYLIKARGIEAERIVVMDGGHREKLEVELYALPCGVSPPTPYSTVDPCRVEIIGNGKARNKRCSSRPPEQLRRKPN